MPHSFTNTTAQSFSITLSPSRVLCEESAVSTFGHGGVGIEITKRRKGGPGGRLLWKVGRGSN
jgi:hypothetical protein